MYKDIITRKAGFVKMPNEAYFQYDGKGRKQAVIAKPVADALTVFCQQEPEFAQAIDQSDKTFADCLDSIANAIGQACSDLDVFRRAVQFYFPGADVRFEMRIDLGGTQPEQPQEIRLSLDSLLDF